jgi:hypothetical protein
MTLIIYAGDDTRPVTIGRGSMIGGNVCLLRDVVPPMTTPFSSLPAPAACKPVIGVLC